MWTTRIRNIWTDDDLSTGGQWGRTALALSFTGLALAVGHAVYHRSSWLRPVVLALAGWTTAVWVVRAVDIATGDQDAAFIVVHVVLGAISIALAGLAAREVREVPRAVDAGVGDP